MRDRLRKKSFATADAKGTKRLDALHAMIGHPGYILLPPKFAVLSAQRTFSAAW